jgi:uncharacterized membrane protein YoaK (UPF0700 family)
LKKHTKKLIAPIVITVLMILYYFIYLWMGVSINDMPIIMKIIVIIFAIGLIGLTIYMLFERIGEIKGGEEDDLSKY